MVGCKHGKVDLRIAPVFQNKSYFLVKRLKVIAICYLNQVFIYDDLDCCFKYLNVEYPDEIFKTYH